MIGRKLKVQLRGKNYLHMSHVRVFGFPAVVQPQVVTQVTTTTQAPVASGGGLNGFMGSRLGAAAGVSVLARRGSRRGRSAFVRGSLAIGALGPPSAAPPLA